MTRGSLVKEQRPRWRTAMIVWLRGGDLEELTDSCCLSSFLKVPLFKPFPTSRFFIPHSDGAALLLWSLEWGAEQNKQSSTAGKLESWNWCFLGPSTCLDADTKEPAEGRTNTWVGVNKLGEVSLRHQWSLWHHKVLISRFRELCT